jgi:hypothetical protein
VLAEGLWWRGKARSELPTVSRRQRRTVIVGEGASVGIGRWLGAREHERWSGKLAEELAGAMGDRRLLPTATSTSPEELGVLAAGGLAVQLERAQATGVAEQKGEGDKASMRAIYRGGEVAAGGCSGRPRRAQGRIARRGTGPSSGRGLRVEGGEAGGGRRRPARWRPGEMHWRQSRGGRGPEDRGGAEEEEEREQARRTSLKFLESSRAS